MRWRASPAGVPSPSVTTYCARSCSPSAVRSCTRSSTCRRRPNCSFRRRGVCTPPSPESDARSSTATRAAGRSSFPARTTRRPTAARRSRSMARSRFCRGSASSAMGRWSAASAANGRRSSSSARSASTAALVVDERVTNEGDDAAHFTWGHHLVLGPPFLEPGSRLETPARTIVTIPELWEDTARLEPGSGAHGLTRDSEKAAPSIFARSPGPRQRATTTCT